MDEQNKQTSEQTSEQTEQTFVPLTKAQNEELLRKIEGKDLIGTRKHYYLFKGEKGNSIYYAIFTKHKKFMNGRYMFFSWIEKRTTKNRAYAIKVMKLSGHGTTKKAKARAGKLASELCKMKGMKGKLW